MSELAADGIPVAVTCRILKLARQLYCRWLANPVSDAELVAAYRANAANGLGSQLSQQLVAAGEVVLDVPATLASRVRVLATGRSAKTDPNDAMSVAVAALRFDGLRRVSPVGHADVLRLLAKRNHDLGRQRNRVVSRMPS